jgi:DNA-binding NtrC family response regulator
VKQELTILIADRNPHIREFLKREMIAEGYRVCLARNGREVLRWVYHPDPLHLLILDPDLPDAEEVPLLEKLSDRIPTLPVVVHTFLSDYTHYPPLVSTDVFVEKEGTSIEGLKKVIDKILRKTEPPDA